MGTDTITIAGTNSYSGPTIVEGGTLSIPNSLGSSPVQWAGGQTAGLVLNPSSYATAVTLALATGVSNPVVSGQSVAFTATVSTVNNGYGPPTGWVDFYDEATDTDSGEIGVVGARPTGRWKTPAGDHYIVATYTSDTGTYVDGTCDEFDETVNQADTTTAVVVPGSDPTFGNVTLAATVTVNSPGSGTPTGTVEFWDGTTDLGTGNYDSTGGDWTLGANTLASGRTRLPPSTTATTTSTPANRRRPRSPSTAAGFRSATACPSAGGRSTRAPRQRSAAPSPGSMARPSASPSIGATAPAATATTTASRFISRQAQRPSA